jgi:hypothetical protein
MPYSTFHVRTINCNDSCGDETSEFPSRSFNLKPEQSFLCCCFCICSLFSANIYFVLDFYEWRYDIMKYSTSVKSKTIKINKINVGFKVRHSPEGLTRLRLPHNGRKLVVLPHSGPGLIMPSGEGKSEKNHSIERVVQNHITKTN